MNLKDIVVRWLFPAILLIGIYYVNAGYEASYTRVFRRGFELDQIKVQTGDSLEWKKLDYNDAHWDSNFPEPPSFYWWRVEVNIDSILLMQKPLGVGLWSYLGSYDIFWDEVKLGNNGVPQPDTTEVIGSIDRVFYLPDSLSAQGKHLLAVRASQQFSTHIAGEPFIVVRNYDGQTQGLIIQAVYIHIFAGIFLIIAIYYFLVYFNDFKQWIFLIFGLISLLFFGNVIFSYVKFYYKYPYPLMSSISISVAMVRSCIAILVPVFYLQLFKVKNNRIFTGIICFGVIIIFLFRGNIENYNSLIITTFIIFSLPIILWANYNKTAGSLETLYGILPLVLIPFFNSSFFYFNISLLFCFTVMVFSNLVLLSKIMGRQRALNEEMVQVNNRLKLELIRKNIQPHFIMNTLTSLISWVEDSPKTAVKFIESLAKEFEILNNVAERKQIALGEELKLCRSHMEIMGYRNEAKYYLLTKGIDENEMIPPAIFLNLVENGITHNINEEEVINFEIKFENIDGMKTYTFFAPGKPQKPLDGNQKKVKDGNGLKYIKARLEESFPQEWQLNSYPNEKGWVTEIVISI